MNELIASIPKINRELEPELKQSLDDLAHPPGSLGRLEEAVIRIGMMRGSTDLKLGRSVVFTFGADHGVWAEDVSTQPQSVTAEMVKTMCNGRAAINLLAQQCTIEEDQ